MPELQCRHLENRIEQGVLVLTITETQLQEESVATELHQEMLAAVAHWNARKVVVSFQNIRYISSVAFRPLLSLRRKLLEKDGRLILCALEKVVGDVFYTTRLISSKGSLDAPFEIETDVPAAVALLAGNGQKK